MTLSRRDGERGTTIVEAAITMLWFLLCLFGVMEAGRFMSVQVTLTNAAREGARVAVLPLAGTSSLAGQALVEAAVFRFLDANSIPRADATVTLTPLTVGVTDYTLVTVSAPYHVMSVGSFFGVLEVTLSGHARMRNETSP